jgi:hypothetical protein
MDSWAVDVNPGSDLKWGLEYLGRLQAQGYRATRWPARVQIVGIADLRRLRPSLVYED